MTLADRLYLFCGSDNENILNDMYAYDIKTKTWTLIQCKGQIPHIRSGCKGVTYGSDIFYFGGYTYRKGEYFSDIYRFNTKNNTWTAVYSGKEISPRVDHSFVLFNKMLYVFGGSDGKLKLDDFFRFDINNYKVYRVIGDGE